MAKYRVQGEVTIFIDYIEEEADSLAIAINAGKQWARDEYLRGLGWEDFDINITAVEEEPEATPAVETAVEG